MRKERTIVERGRGLGIQGANSIRNFFPSTDAALESVVRVRLVSVASSSRLSEARLVCIFLAIEDLVRF